MKSRPLLSLPVFAVALFATQSGQAQNNMPRIVNQEPHAGVAYWTPERLRAAQPLAMPSAPASAIVEERGVQVLGGKAEGRDARPPTLQVRLPVRRLFTPEATPQRAVVTPHASNSEGRSSYTSTRVFPMFSGTAAPYSADRAYPYITVGRLFFTDGARPLFCSAAVIQRRIVVTAGHCVHSGTARGFFNNWMFVPAYRDGTAPLLTWNWRAAIVTGTWAGSGGSLPNEADYAMIEFDDQAVGGSIRALGNVTGWLGWQTLSLEYNHTSKLGYPCNLDNCQKMQNVMSTDIGYASNNVHNPSDAREGSDGGPWVQNFQVLQVGGGIGYNTGSNRVVGVTSRSNIYNFPTSDSQVQAASIPDGRWVNIFNASCSRVPGNCQ